MIDGLYTLSQTRAHTYRQWWSARGASCPQAKAPDGFCAHSPNECTLTHLWACTDLKACFWKKSTSVLEIKADRYYQQHIFKCGHKPKNVSAGLLLLDIDIRFCFWWDSFAPTVPQQLAITTFTWQGLFSPHTFCCEQFRLTHWRRHAHTQSTDVMDVPAASSHCVPTVGETATKVA